jgi:hypothetical protein
MGGTCWSNCKSNLKNIGTALEMYSSDYGGRNPDSLQKLVPRYLASIPTYDGPRRNQLIPEPFFWAYHDISRGKDTYSIGYVVTSNPDNYTVYCSGHSHPGYIMRGFPQYDAIQGLYDH